MPRMLPPIPVLLMTLVSLAALAATASPARAQDAVAVGASVHQAVDRLFAHLDGPGTPGAVLAVMRDGEVIYQRSYGMANLEYGIPVSAASRFQLASVSKQFAAFAIHLLAAEGRLSLDDDIREHLPELHDFGHTITIAHMLHHTSGLRELSTLRTVAGWRSSDLTTHADQLDFAVRLRELNFEPGSRYVYNNLGYALLAEIVQRVSGQSLREFSAERIFGPLGMTSTHVADLAWEPIPDRAPSYARSGDRWEERLLNTSHIGSSGVFTTLEDMVKWDRNFYHMRVGGPAVMEAMLRPGRLSDGRDVGYASGLMLQTYRGQRVVQHTGSHAGYRSAVFRVPEQRFTVIILSNNASMNSTELPRRVTDIFLAPVLTAPDPAEEGDVDAAVFSPLFAAAAGSAGLAVFGAGATGAASLATLAAADEGTAGPGISAAGGEAGLGASAAGAGDNTSPTATPALDDFLGMFYSDEADAIVRIERQDERLVLRHRKGSSNLQSTGEDTFNGLGSALRFVRAADGTVTGFFVTNQRANDIRFMRAELRILGNQREQHVRP